MIEVDSSFQGGWMLGSQHITSGLIAPFEFLIPHPKWLLRMFLLSTYNTHQTVWVKTVFSTLSCSWDVLVLLRCVP